MGTISPRFGAVYRPVAPVNRPLPPIQDPLPLVARLGLQTKMLMDGNVLYNEPLVQSLVNCREMAIPALKTLFQSTNNTPVLLEGLYAAGKMAEAKVNNLEELYPALTRWNSHPDPTIQMHLARFYRKINEPKTFGPMLSTAVNYAVNMYPMSSSSSYNVTEEVGSTLLDQIARRTAQETVRQLLPFIQNKPFQPMPPVFLPNNKPNPKP